MDLEVVRYTPRYRDVAGTGIRPRKIMGWVKDAHADVLERIATLCKEREFTAFKGVFGPDATLVPVPCLFRRSRPPIPSETVHLFRAKPSTDFGPSRPG